MGFRKHCRGATGDLCTSSPGRRTFTLSSSRSKQAADLGQPGAGAHALANGAATSYSGRNSPIRSRRRIDRTHRANHPPPLGNGARRNRQPRSRPRRAGAEARGTTEHPCTAYTAPKRHPTCSEHRTARRRNKNGKARLMTNDLRESTGAAFRPQDVAALATNVGGPVLVPGSAGFADECATFNLNCGFQPALMVGATSEDDVVTAVRFAARHGLPIAVKSSGHQVVLPAHGAMLITTERMRGFSMDARRQTARAEPGLKVGDVVARTSEAGLAPVMGSAPGVGIVGYTLGGGQSPLLGRLYGYAADHVRRVNIVTADGELRNVTAESEPELFWALRGGKGNFGVVTEIEFGLFPVARFFGGGIYFPGERLADVLEAWRTWLPTIPEEMTSSVAIQRLPDVPLLPEPLRGAFVVHLRIGYLGPAAEGEKLVAPLRAAAPPLLDLLEDKPVSAVGEIHMDPVDPMPYVDRTVSLGE